jgi:hypothetical protein
VAANSYALNSVAVIAALLAALLTIAVAANGLTRVFRYSLGASTLNISIVGFTCRRVRFSDIEGVKVVPFVALIPLSPSFHFSFLLSEKWNGYRREVIAIDKRTGWLKGVIISPNHPGQFAELLREAIASQPACANRE